MKYTIKYIEKILDDKLKTFKKNDFKKRATEELKKIENETGKKYPEIAYVIASYPSFNSFMFRFGDEKNFRMEICISPELLRTKKARHEWARYILACMGGRTIDYKKETKEWN